MKHLRRTYQRYVVLIGEGGFYTVVCFARREAEDFESESLCQCVGGCGKDGLTASGIGKRNHMMCGLWAVARKADQSLLNVMHVVFRLGYAFPALYDPTSIERLLQFHTILPYLRYPALFTDKKSYAESPGPMTDDDVCLECNKKK